MSAYAIARHLFLMATLSLLSCSDAKKPRSEPDPPITSVATSDEWKSDNPTPGRNVIVIISDTMRRDRIGAYGGPAKTPTFDAFGSANFLFEDAYSQAPWTKPSIATAFTSLYPSQHGVRHHPQKEGAGGGIVSSERPIMEMDVLGEKFTTLAEALQSAGIRTAGFVGNPWMSSTFGFSQGFDQYDDSFAKWDAPGDVVSRAGLKWLQALESESRFFLYLHYMDCHRPYVTLDPADLERRIDELNADERPVTNRAAREITRVVRRTDGQSAAQGSLRPTVALAEYAYDKGAEQFDRVLKVFLDGFRSHPAYDRTAIFVTSDHGEALFDRGYGNHANGLYDDEIAIPLAARFPGVSSDELSISRLVGLVDLMPTVCDYMQVAAPDMVSGRSWLHSNSSTTSMERACLITEGVGNKPFNRAIRTNVHKLIWQPQDGPDGKQHVLFNIQTDPEEKLDLLTKEHYTTDTQDIVKSLLQLGRDAVPEFARSPTQLAPVDQDTLRRLRSLGYVGGSDE